MSTKQTINEVSQALNLSKDTLRYWEEIGLLQPINRDQHGYRAYTESEIEWVKYIRALRNAGLSIQETSDYVTMLRDGVVDDEERLDILRNRRDQLNKKIVDLGVVVQYLNEKIDRFSDVLRPHEHHLLK